MDITYGKVLLKFHIPRPTRGMSRWKAWDDLVFGGGIVIFNYVEGRGKYRDRYALASTMVNNTVRSSPLDVQLYSAFARGDVSLRGSFRIIEKALFQATSGQNDECQLAHVLAEGELLGRS
jgi:hypothetical protein